MRAADLTERDRRLGIRQGCGEGDDTWWIEPVLQTLRPVINCGTRDLIAPILDSLCERYMKGLWESKFFIQQLVFFGPRCGMAVTAA